MHRDRARRRRSAARRSTWPTASDIPVASAHLTDAIASGGLRNSPALAKRLEAAEQEQAARWPQARAETSGAC